MTDELRFDGATVIITGAGRGLGAAHARLLAERGANVVLNDIGTSSDGTSTAELLAAELNELGGRAVAVTGSIADRDTAAELVDAAIRSYGGIDVVVNNAGIGRPAPIPEFDDEALQEELGVHLLGPLQLVRASWPHLRESSRAVIISTISGVGLFGSRRHLGYGTAKMGVVGATRSLAVEGRLAGIRVNALAPIAQTELSGTANGDLADVLDPALVSSVVAWLAHPSCALTGQVISAGGGRVALVRIAVGRGRLARTPEEVAAVDLADDQFIELDESLEEHQVLRAFLAEIEH